MVLQPSLSVCVCVLVCKGSYPQKEVHGRGKAHCHETVWLPLSSLDTAALPDLPDLRQSGGTSATMAAEQQRRLLQVLRSCASCSITSSIVSPVGHRIVHTSRCASRSAWGTGTLALDRYTKRVAYTHSHPVLQSRSHLNRSVGLFAGSRPAINAFPQAARTMRLPLGGPQ